MAAVRKIGLFSAVVPSLDELCAIREVRRLAGGMAKLPINRKPTESYYWHRLREEWPKISYYKNSKTLSKSFVTKSNFDIESFLFSPSDSLVQELDWGNRFNALVRELGWGNRFDEPEKLHSSIQTVIKARENSPVKLDILRFHDDWIFKEYHYETEGLYSEAEFRLLILEEFDKQRQYFEALKQKYELANVAETLVARPGIAESVRIQVWRRDGGKCTRCGSRERLEYDHIIPLSKGGSNTSRNIELLCEICNRNKSNKIQ